MLSAIKSKGYKGSPAALYRYLKKHIKTSVPPQRHYKRYETAHDEQMRYDWPDYTGKMSAGE